jgi:DNA polymerase I
METLLFDGHNLLFRSFTTVPRSVTGKDDQPINGVYGLVASILRLIREVGAEHGIAAFDVPAVPTFRQKLYPQYQGQRGPLGGDYADDFARQVTVAKEVLPHLGVQTAECEGYEADDVLATMASRIAASSQSATVVSTDRDLLQLVCEGIQVMLPSNPSVIIRTEEEVRARIGVSPELIPDYKALAGDPSDNIPGVQGIGAKTAIALVNEFGSIEDIYRHLEYLAPRARAALEGQRERAFLFKRITTVVRDLPLSASLDHLPKLEVRSATRARDVLDSAGY